MRFGWSDDLAELLIAQDQVPASELAAWIFAPTAHRLPEDTTDLEFARDLFGSSVRHDERPFEGLRAS